MEEEKELVQMMKEIVQEIKEIQSVFLKQLNQIKEENRKGKHKTKGLNSKLQYLKRDKKKNNVVISGPIQDTNGEQE